MCNKKCNSWVWTITLKERQMRWVGKQGFTGKKFKLLKGSVGKWLKGSQVNPKIQTFGPVCMTVLNECPSELELKLLILSCVFLNFPALFPIDFYLQATYGEFLQICPLVHEFCRLHRSLCFWFKQQSKTSFLNILLSSFSNLSGHF